MINKKGRIQMYDNDPPTRFIKSEGVPSVFFNLIFVCMGN